MAFRLTPATAAQLSGLALFFAGIGITLYGITVAPQQLQNARGLEGPLVGLGGVIESPLPSTLGAVITVGNYALAGAAIAWIVGASGIGLLGWGRLRIAPLLASCALLGAIGLALVFWWLATCSGAGCYPTGLRDAGIGLLVSFAGLTSFAAASAVTSARSTPRPGP